MAKYLQEFLPNGEPYRIKKPGNDCEKYSSYEKLLYNTYKKNEIIVYFKDPPSDNDIEEVKKSFLPYGFQPEGIKVRRCDNCDISLLLFQAENIHTVINTEGVKAGPGTHTTTVGENYSLNFYNHLPFDKDWKLGRDECGKDDINDRKEKIVVAVLDTGFDDTLIDKRYLWNDEDRKQDSKCYNEVATGWNFVNDTADFSDDNENRHGSIVSQYIINEFKNSRYNQVQIMSLKTHNKDGIGDLFGIICAIYFAIAKGADLINASWGFYYYHDSPIPYLQELITQTLNKKGIPFITAAGNKVDQDDVIAKQIFFSEHGVNLTADQLRNLVIHNFYPAKLSDDANAVITVTTTDGRKVSATQNYSNEYADLGVLADLLDPDGIHMKFKVPFSWSDDFISGSSFATAIATGIIGTFMEKGSYAPGTNKSAFFDFLSSRASTEGFPQIFFNDESLADKYIKKGLFTKKLS